MWGHGSVSFPHFVRSPALVPFPTSVFIHAKRSHIGCLYLPFLCYCTDVSLSVHILHSYIYTHIVYNIQYCIHIAPFVIIISRLMLHQTEAAVPHHCYSHYVTYTDSNVVTFNNWYIGGTEDSVVLRDDLQLSCAHIQKHSHNKFLFIWLCRNPNCLVSIRNYKVDDTSKFTIVLAWKQ